jgi:cytochrome c oxidase assembly protein subunit 15
MIRPLIILFLLGALQGLVGWIMVQSGLENSELLFVSHYRLAIHFILALVLLVYAMWFALQLLVPNEQLIVNARLRKFLISLTVLIFIQFVYGAFMAGLKAAPAAPTWPDMNNGWLPSNIDSYGGHQFQGLSFLWDHPLVIHFVHRNLAYIITILVFVWTWKASKFKGSELYRRTFKLPAVIVFFQLLLGVFAVLNAADQKTFLWLGVAHQFGAMLLLLSFTWELYIIRGKNYVLGR